jgi:hypothetical protein
MPQQDPLPIYHDVLSEPFQLKSSVLAQNQSKDQAGEILTLFNYFSSKNN